jgi:hypothetical protein
MWRRYRFNGFDATKILLFPGEAVAPKHDPARTPTFQKIGQYLRWHAELHLMQLQTFNLKIHIAVGP